MQNWEAMLKYPFPLKWLQSKYAEPVPIQKDQFEPMEYQKPKEDEMLQLTPCHDIMAASLQLHQIY